MNIGQGNIAVTQNNNTKKTRLFYKMDNFYFKSKVSDRKCIYLSVISMIHIVSKKSIM